MTPAISLPNGMQIPAMGERFGVKGADAPALLQQWGMRIPTLPNRVAHWEAHESFGRGRCLRQGNTEFLIEVEAGNTSHLQPSESLSSAWMLIRTDHCLLLDATWPAALSHICSFDFDRLRGEPDLVVMTLMAGIGVTLVREPSSAIPHSSGMALRLWCDAGYSTYLQDCLRSIGESR